MIEDTESSIDLADRGWTLVNYPERLAYSATPADFGSLLIQRRRWANGGLIILPKALRYLFRGPKAWRKTAEAFCRIHYLTSVAFANIALLVILFGSWERNAHIAWLLVSSLPYMYIYARDLVLCGYRWSDFPRVYALNVLLVPIHLGGSLKSLHQAATGRKTPFARTPKVTGRTVAPGRLRAGRVWAAGGSAGHDRHRCPRPALVERRLRHCVRHRHRLRHLLLHRLARERGGSAALAAAARGPETGSCVVVESPRRLPVILPGRRSLPQEVVQLPRRRSERAKRDERRDAFGGCGEGDAARPRPRRARASVDRPPEGRSTALIRRLADALFGAVRRASSESDRP